MKKCPNGHEVSDEVKFCPICGAEVVEKKARFCPQCGYERQGSEKFCPKCGAAFEASKVVEKKKSRRGFAIASSLCLLALVIAGAIWYYLNHFQQDYSLEKLAAVVVECDEVRNFHDGLAAIRKDNKWGYLDKEGKLVISYTFDEANDFCEGYAILQKGDKWGFIDKTGKEVIPCVYDMVEDFHEGLALVMKDGKYGYIDKTNKQVIPRKYDAGKNFSEGLAAVLKGDKWGYIDKKGKEVISCVYERAEAFHEGLALVSKDEKYAFINKDGEGVLALGDKYIEVRGFHDGLALVESENGESLRYGFIDKKGKVVIPEIYYSYRGDYGEFHDGYAIVYKDGEGFGAIDKTNKVIIPFKDDQYITFSEGLFCVRGNEKHSFFDTNGNRAISSIFDSGSDFSEGLAAVKKDDIWGFVDKKGNSTFDVQNEDVQKIVQEKIQEKKEEIRRQKEEEERREEEERIRIEEENKPTNKFYNIASSGNYVWESNGYGFDYGEGERTLLYFYPNNKDGGRMTYLNVPKDYNGYSRNLSGTGSYSVSGEYITCIIHGRNFLMGTSWNKTISFVVEKNNDVITLNRLSNVGHEVTNLYYIQKTKSIQDPYLNQ